MFGTSANISLPLEKSGVEPQRDVELAQLRTMLSTGSPLAPESFDYVYGERQERRAALIHRPAAQTLSCFALGNPLLPVYRGELQCRGLGMKVEIFDDEGRRCAAKGRARLHGAVPFDAGRLLERPRRSQVPRGVLRALPGVWCHGDYASSPSTAAS